MNRGGQRGALMELERRAHQIKEVVRVSAALRADMPPEVICVQVAQTIHSMLGFRAAVVNLIIPGMRHFIIAATAGISEPERNRLINDPPPVDHVLSLMRNDFRVGNSYFIGHEHKYILEGAGGIVLLTPSALAVPRGPNSWHPDDVFFVPLYSPRENRLLGLISLDLPEDGKIPSPETVEVIELLANQAAVALDTARLFQERDQERKALEQGLAELMIHLERMRQRDFSARAQMRGSALTQVAGALNDVSETLGNVLADVRDAGMVVQQQASEMRNAASLLTDSAQRQADQIRSVSEAIQQTSSEMRQIVVRAADSSAIAGEAEGISREGRQAAEAAGEGMNAVREITLQAAKRIKRLGESSQEIGNVIQLVSDFASQTHLLALNAAIEAANAGEHGKGFAIVAHEIRTLAQNSNEATKQIQARIKVIQNETNQVAVTIEHATQQVVLLSDLVSHSGSALHAIDSAIQRMVNVIAAMHQTAEEQARAAATVSGTMANIAGITGATWESAEQMRASMDRLAELASILQAKIELFRLSGRLQPTGAPLPQQPPQLPSQQPPMAQSGAHSGATPAASFPAASYPAQPFASSGPAAPTAKPPEQGDMALQPTVPMSTVQPPPIAPTPFHPYAPFVPSSGRSIPTPTPTFRHAPMGDPQTSGEILSARNTAKLTTPLADIADSLGYSDVSDSTGDAVAAGDTTGDTAGNVPTPAPIFPMTSSPLTPMRLSALDERESASGIPTYETSGAPPDESAMAAPPDRYDGEENRDGQDGADPQAYEPTTSAMPATRGADGASETGADAPGDSTPDGAPEDTADVADEMVVAAGDEMGEEVGDENE